MRTPTKSPHLDGRGPPAALLLVAALNACATPADDPVTGVADALAGAVPGEDARSATPATPGIEDAAPPGTDRPGPLPSANPDAVAGGADALGDLDAAPPGASAVRVWVSTGDARVHEAAVAHDVTLRTALGGLFLSAEEGGGGALHADRPEAQGWEHFTLLDLNGGEVESGDRVALRTHDGHFVSAAGAGGGAVDARAESMRAWEIFRIELLEGGTQAAFQAWDAEHYLSAVDGGGGDVRATAVAVSGWEAFDVTLGPAQSRWLAAEPELSLAPGVFPDALVIDDTRTFQHIAGFGSSFTQAAAWLLQTRLDEERRQTALRALFDPDEGIGLSAMRLTIGASDMMGPGAGFYTYDDVGPGETDFSLDHFDLAPDAGEVIPLVRSALALAPALYLMASPWSPPAWMKEGGALVGGRLRDDDDVRRVYAGYFVRYVQEMAALGVPIAAVTPQNEPLFEPPHYPGARSDAAAEARFVGGFLGPALANAGLAVEVYAYDHNWDHPEYPLGVLADASARAFTAGSAFHCYGGGIDAQSAVHATHPDKAVWLSECSAGDWEDDPFGGKMWLLINATRHWGAGVLLWNVAMRLTGGPAAEGGCDACRGVLEVDEARGEFLRGVQYYALGHFSRFVRPGAVRIASEGGPAGLQSVAFRNVDDSVVLVAWNGADAAVELSVVYRGRGFTRALEGRTAATFRWTGE